jgi:hypothetical protein
MTPRAWEMLAVAAFCLLIGGMVVAAVMIAP